MNSLRASLIFTCLLTFIPPSLAFGHGNHGHHSHGPKKPKAGELTCESTECEELRSVLDDAHHSIEAGDTGSFLKRWKSKLNLKNTALAAYRWYSSNIDKPHAENVVPNLAVMFLGSHVVETVTGGGLVVHGMSNPGSLQQAVETFFGFLITVPGFDPLCIVLAGSYFRWPSPMNKALTIPRIFVMSAKHAAEFVAGMPNNWIGTLAQNQRIDGFLNGMNHAGDSVIPVSVSGDWLFNIEDDSGDTAAQLKFTQLPDGRYGLEEVMLNENVTGKNWLKRLNMFGVNIRSMVKELQGGRGTATPYIRMSEPDPFGRRYYLNAAAFPFINFDTEECESALTKSLAIQSI